MSDFFYYMPLKLLKISFWRDNVTILRSDARRYNRRHYAIF